MENLALAKMHVKPLLENVTSFSALENTDLDANARQARTFSSPSLLTLLIAATLLAKASAKSHTNYQGYPAWASYKPLGYYNAPYGGHAPTEHPHHHHQLHAPPVNQQQIVNIHGHPRPHGGSSNGGSGTENFEDINEMNHQHIITTIQRPLESIAEEMLGSETVYSIALPDKNSSDSTTDDTVIDVTTESISPLVTPSIDLLDDSLKKSAAETNVNYRRIKPEIIYLKNSGRRTTPSRRNESSKKKSSGKRNQKRPTTFSYYDYEDDPTTSRPRNRRRPTQRRSPSKRRPFDEYDYNSLESTTRYNHRSPSRNKRRPVKTNHRRRPADDSLDSQYYSMEDDYGNDDYYDDDISPRQGTTSTTTESTTSETTSTSTTTTTESTSTSSTTSTTTENPTNKPTEPSKNDTGGYGYGPGSGNDNISITYGPPGTHGSYANYDYANGPSGGGYVPPQPEVPYNPPSIQQRLDYVAPLLDAWYAQYSAKNAVVRRIQELLHQNTQQPQGDNYAYNDNAY